MIKLDHPPTPDELLRIAREHFDRREAMPEAVTAPAPDAEATVTAPVMAPEPTPAVEPPPAPVLEEESIFDPSALYNTLPGRCQWFTMPGGGRVCVHPTSSDDNLWIQRQVLKELRAEKRMPDENADKVRQQEFVLEAQSRAHIWTTIVACRTGEELNAPKVFTEKHALALRRNPGWAEACGAIAQISAKLGEGESEAEALRRLLEGFFARLGSWLPTIAGPNSTGPTSSRISRFVTCASSAKPLEQRLVELTHLLNQPE